MKAQILPVFVLSILLFACSSGAKEEPALKNALNGKFLIGVAVNEQQALETDSSDTEIIVKHFNSIVAENCMKSERIQPQKGVFAFDAADRFVAFGEKHNMFIIGHTLVWHSQAPRWFFTDDEGNDVSREVLIDRIREHIYTLVGRYKGRVHGWDVVNEAIEEDGSLRNSKFLQIIGEEYISLAFQFAHEADPDAELYYNDFNTMKPAKRDAICQLVKKLQEQGLRVDGIGMQGHMTMTFPTAELTEQAIEKFAELGQVMITEMDMTVLPWPEDQVTADVSFRRAADPAFNPYPESLTDSASVAWTNRFMEFFTVFLNHSDKISRVTMWGLNDQQTWRNNWPIPGRKDYPLLFDRQNQPKPIVDEIYKAVEAMQ
ncbi:MAG TPA: endo-1,4-beta-xylanase [Prolixibacteraceae bacterium]|nr:endo-1,4-beta-xylanase [Prolixibacteraceae bacterium]